MDLKDVYGIKVPKYMKAQWAETSGTGEVSYTAPNILKASFNTVESNTTSASLDTLTGVFTFPPGIYRVDFQTQFCAAGDAKGILFDNSDDSVIAQAVNGYCVGGNQRNSPLLLIRETLIFESETEAYLGLIGNANSSYAFGVAVASGSPECYATATIISLGETDNV